MRRLTVLLAVVAAAVSGCTLTVSSEPSSASSPATAQARTGVLYAVHDPGQVTGAAPAAGSCHALAGPRPDPACTPGAIDPAVTQADIGSTICRSGYTASVRPPTSQTDRLKAQMYQAYGIADGTVSELDHAVPLELGGANDVKNLWPEIGRVPNPKDKIETALKNAVCSGRVTLTAAQQAIATDWQSAEQDLGLGG